MGDVGLGVYRNGVEANRVDFEPIVAGVQEVEPTKAPVPIGPVVPDVVSPDAPTSAGS